MCNNGFCFLIRIRKEHISGAKYKLAMRLTNTVLLYKTNHCSAALLRAAAVHALQLYTRCSSTIAASVIALQPSPNASVKVTNLSLEMLAASVSRRALVSDCPKLGGTGSRLHAYYTATKLLRVTCSPLWTCWKFVQIITSIRKRAGFQSNS